jgi:glycosyltransferase involved in cell wall biosynthesis
MKQSLIRQNLSQKLQESSRLKVIQLTRNMEGGAGVFTRRLHDALKRLGIDSSIIVRDIGGMFTDARTMDSATSRTKRLLERIEDKLERLVSHSHAGPFVPITRPYNTCVDLPVDFRGIVHLHWIAKWLDLGSALKSIPRSIPVIVSLHDVSTITGGCCIYNGCDRFKADCRPCPLLKAPFDRFVANRELRRKARAFATRNLFVVGNSSWTTAMARESSVFSAKTNFTTILPGLPSEFRPLDKRAARTQMNLPLDMFILGFAAAELTDDNKQFPLFEQALARCLKERPALGIAIGGGTPRLSLVPENSMRFTGKISDPSKLAVAYAAMDLLVFPSRMESFGQVAAEASVCGTPTCAFRVGGIPDIIQHDCSGLLATPRNDQEFLRNISHLILNPNLLAKLGEQAAIQNRERFTLQRFAQEYLTVYRSALTEVGSGAS